LPAVLQIAQHLIMVDRAMELGQKEISLMHSTVTISSRCKMHKAVISMGLGW
jgi:5,10-methenyltetrahydromethanopterin hydrogenase